MSTGDATGGSSPRFEFGKNWLDFTARGLDPSAYEIARKHIAGVCRQLEARESFLDIGCGSGLFLLAAAELGFTRALGFDYDPNSVEATRGLLTNAGVDGISVVRGDVLDGEFLATLGTHSVVYAWGSLHHTGDMWRAIDNASELVEPGGLLVLAIYNRTWSSPAWRAIKRLYVSSGPLVQRGLVGATWAVGASARALYTRSNPFKQRRGMSFFHNMVDWVGGYPYEYASVDEVIRYVEARPFETVSAERGPTPIACNEFVFRRHS